MNIDKCELPLLETWMGDETMSKKFLDEWSVFDINNFRFTFIGCKFLMLPAHAWAALKPV